MYVFILGLLFCPIDLCFQFCASTILIILALQFSLRSGNMLPLALFFFLKIVLAIQGLLFFHANFIIICSNSVKNAIGVLIGIALILYIALGSKVILKIFFLSMWMRCLSISLHHLQFLLSMFYSFSTLGLNLDWIYSQIFFLFDTIINGLFLIFSFYEILCC